MKDIHPRNTPNLEGHDPLFSTSFQRTSVAMSFVLLSVGDQLYGSPSLFRLSTGKNLGVRSDNYYSKQSNNLQDWLYGWIIIVPPINDLLIPIII